MCSKLWYVYICIPAHANKTYMKKRNTIVIWYIYKCIYTMVDMKVLTHCQCQTLVCPIYTTHYDNAQYGSTCQLCNYSSGIKNISPVSGHTSTYIDFGKGMNTYFLYKNKYIKYHMDTYLDIYTQRQVLRK